MFEIAIFSIITILALSTTMAMYLKIRENFIKDSEQINKEYEAIQNEYNETKEKIAELKKRYEELEREFVKLKSMEEQKRISHNENRITEKDILLRDRLVTRQDIKKAEEFIQMNGSSFSVLDALLLLGKIDLKTAEYVKAQLYGNGL